VLLSRVARLPQLTQTRAHGFHSRSWLPHLLAPDRLGTNLRSSPLACFTLAFFALRAHREFLAGLALGCPISKRQLGLAAAIVFLLTLRWKIIAGALLSATVELLPAWSVALPFAAFNMLIPMRRLADSALSPNRTGSPSTTQ
jgi:hypothetical protein